MLEKMSSRKLEYVTSYLFILVDGNVFIWTSRKILEIVRIVRVYLLVDGNVIIWTSRNILEIVRVVRVDLTWS